MSIMPIKVASGQYKTISNYKNKTIFLRNSQKA